MKRKKEILNQSVSQTSILLNKKFKIVLFLIVSIIAISYFSFVLLCFAPDGRADNPASPFGTPLHRIQ